MGTMAVTEARATFSNMLDRVAAGEEVTITRHGRPVAVVVRPDSLHSRRAGPALTLSTEIAESMAAARRSPRPGSGVTADRAEELIAEVRAGRAR